MGRTRRLIVSLGASLLLHQLAVAKPFTITDRVRGLEGQVVGLYLTQGEQVKSRDFFARTVNGVATFTFNKDVPFETSGTAPPNAWRDWHQFIPWINGQRLPLGSGPLPMQQVIPPGTYEVVGNNVQTLIDVAFLGTQAPFAFELWADTLVDTRGLQEVFFPNFMADLNHNGVLDDSDTLYVGVNASLWLNSALSRSELAPGTEFSITNGTTPLLPGYIFSTTPLTFNSAVGYTGTPPGAVEIVFNPGANHTSSVIPEPASMLLLILGITILSGFKVMGADRRSS